MWVCGKNSIPLAQFDIAIKYISVKKPTEQILPQEWVIGMAGQNKINL